MLVRVLLSRLLARHFIAFNFQSPVTSHQYLYLQCRRPANFIIRFSLVSAGSSVSWSWPPRRVISLVCCHKFSVNFVEKSHLIALIYSFVFLQLGCQGFWFLVRVSVRCFSPLGSHNYVQN